MWGSRPRVTSIVRLLLTAQTTLCRQAMMRKQPRMSAQTLRVLQALMMTAGGELSGAEVGRASKLPSGTLYPILARLEAAEWLSSRWETEEPQVLGRPRRRFYKVTGLGAQKARVTFKELEPSFGRLAWT